MNKELKGKKDFKLVFSSVILQIVVSALFVVIFAAIMYFLEIDNKYSPVFGSVAVAFGAFVNAVYLSSKKKRKGYLYGAIVGGITFIIITLVGLVLNEGGVTVNTLFHFIIILLSAIAGGILGVNKRENKYI